MVPTGPPHSALHGSHRPSERGAALIVVLVMLLLLTILGATLFTSSTTEIKIAGNYRNSLETFFAAEAAVDFAMTNAAIYTAIIPGEADTWPPAQQSPLISIPGTNIKANIQVTLVSPRNNPPPGSGYQEDAGVGFGSEQSFKANLFAISVEAHGPNEARTDVEAGMARIVPH